MPEMEFVGQRVCRPEALLTFRVSRFAEQCDAGPAIIAAVFACVHALNRVSEERIAVGFPEAEFGEGPTLGGVISACGSIPMMDELRMRVEAVVASGGLVISAHDPDACPRQAFVRIRTQDRSTSAGKQRADRRRARKRAEDLAEGKVLESPEFLDRTSKPVRIGAHVNVVMHGQKHVIRLGQTEAEPDREILVSTWGLSRSSDPRPVPVHG